ncbi:MAG: hypothetical protein ACI841_001691 [Planctomycetota bacterium]|jgi:hypothetical protein
MNAASRIKTNVGHYRLDGVLAMSGMEIVFAG